jgi:SAM-dependent methyltransferase
VSDAELERIRTAYQARDASGDNPYRWDNPGYVTFMQLVERALLRAFDDAGVQLAGARVLDVGCGGGYFLHRLQEYGAGECHGIDLMENRVEEGRRRYPTLNLRVGSATDLPFGDGEFDLVTQFTCISSIVDAEVRLTVAHEMRRVAGGGWLLSFDMRGKRRPTARRASTGTPTVAIDEAELRRLFGEPMLLRRAALAFELAQFAGRHTMLATALGALRPLRSHLLGLWRLGPEPVNERGRRP